MNLTVEVSGLKGVEDALSEAGPKLAKSILRKGLLEAAQFMVYGAKSRCPVAVEGTPQTKPGELRDAIGVSSVKLNGKKERASVKIGPKYDKKDGSQSPGVYGLFVEVGSVHNPTPKPFMRSTFDADAQTSLEKFTDVTRAALPELGKK